jgi:poly(3-hydroxybutyrate) depolymerase
VAFFAIEGGGHAWPGGAQDGDEGDPPTRALNASVELVRFFMQHPLRPPTAALTPRRDQ